MGRGEFLQGVGKHLIEKPVLGKNLFYVAVDLDTISIDGKSRARANRKQPDRLGIVALVRTANLALAQSESMHDLGGAGNQRDNAKHLTSVAGPLVTAG